MDPAYRYGGDNEPHSPTDAPQVNSPALFLTLTCYFRPTINRFIDEAPGLFNIFFLCTIALDWFGEFAFLVAELHN